MIHVGQSNGVVVSSCEVGAGDQYQESSTGKLKGTIFKTYCFFSGLSAE